MAYALIPGSVALLAALLWAVGAVGERLALSAELQRKVVHVAVGGYCLTYPLMFDAAWQVATTCAIAVALMLALRAAQGGRAGLGSAIHRVERRSDGDIVLGLAVALLFFLKRDQVVLYLLPIAIMTFADTAAALVGSRYGRRTFPVEGGSKSLEGVAAFFVVAWLISIAFLIFLTPLATANLLTLGFALALFGASIEAECWSGWDNLFVPLGIFLLLRTCLHATGPELAVAVAVLVALLAIALGAARGPRVDSRSVRIAALTVYGIWLAGGSIQIVTPLVALLALALVEARETSADRHRHLQPVLTVVDIALVWFVVGEVGGFATHGLFQLSLGIAVAALLGLALWPRRRAILGAIVGWWLVVVLAMTAGGELDGLDPVFVGAALVVMLAAAYLAPQAHSLLARQRAHRLALAAILGALALLPIAPP